MLYCSSEKSAIVLLFVLLSQNVLQVSLKQYQIPSLRGNWFKAFEFCRSIGMQLATIRSRDENDAIARYIQDTDKYNDVSSTFWIGGSDLAEEGTFSWMPTGRLVTFSNWSPGEPNNAFGSEHCTQLVYIPRFEQRWTWNDNNCTDLYIYFVCETASQDCIKEF
ncbi:C-type lectin 37Da-like [Toxorhynchites rutilus septentrionalis]|uniref:C-type lectin 37Da-like n=1 Tax=Toxorhynchites rutilus septentrionalis TaxID=329112 RepID=UPI0024785C3E|nr:C-type lectin 37Da-like [Toxorhynchites rutilus septentrionalis]